MLVQRGRNNNRFNVNNHNIAQRDGERNQLRGIRAEINQLEQDILQQPLGNFIPKERGSEDCMQG